MRELFYKPYLAEYKTPVGGVQAGTDFEIRIRITERDDIESVYFVLTKDEESPMYYKMKNEGEFYVIKMKVTSAGLYFYHFEVRQYDGYFNIFSDLDLMPQYHYGNEWVLLSYEKKYEFASFLKGGMIYQIMVDRFCSVDRKKTRADAIYRDDWYGIPEYKPNDKGKILNNDFFGGNLKGVISKLDYIKSLGATCIYLNPIFEAKSNHKYDTGDYANIDPDFGTEEDLKTLIAEAKARGMSIMLDGVFSHQGDDSKYFNKYGNYDSVGAYQSKDSPYYEWYTFKKYPDSYECWWGIDILPNVNETNPKYDEYINGEDGIIAKYTKLGIGGWRLDVADELPDAFLESLTRRVKSVNPKAMVLGEVWEDASVKTAYSYRRKYFWGSQLESVTNYPFKEDIVVFAKQGNAKKLNRTVTTLVDHYPHDVLHSLMNMIGTHDTSRILTAMSDDICPNTRDGRAVKKINDVTKAKKRVMLAGALQFTLPGVPSVFYGDEVGLEGYEDPFNRRCYPWGREDADMLEYFKRLGQMRKRFKTVLTSGDYIPVKADNGVLIFKRKAKAGTLTVIANASEFAYELPVMMQDEISITHIKSIPPSTVAVFKEE